MIPGLDQLGGQPLVEPGKWNMDWTWFLFMTQLVQALQAAITDAGIVPIPLTGTQIAALDPSLSVGTYFYNTTTNKGMINENGVIKTITTS